MLKRWGYFFLTNLLVMLTLGILFNILSAFFGVGANSGYIGSLLFFAFFWGMGGSFISLLLSKWSAKRMFGIRMLDPMTNIVTERELLDLVANLSRAAGLPKNPEVGIFEAEEINAFATGASKDNSLVAVSTGLLRTMNRQEIEGVLGHEITHIANGDMVTLALIQGVVNAFVMFFSRIVAGIIAQNAAERNRMMIRFALSMLFDILFGMLGSMLVCYFSRQREFRADAGGARFAGRDKMIAALKRLKAQFPQIPDDAKSSGTMMITSKPSGVLALFGTHPGLDERIARLERLPS